MSSTALTFNDGGGSVPFGVQLAASQDLRPQVVCAAWDGTGASGSFLACLSLYSQSGVLISRTAPPVTFAAGDTGVVTYAPFLGREPSVAPVAGFGPAFEVDNSSGADDWSDIWYAANGAASSVQVTSNAANTFYLAPARVSPDSLHITFLYAPVSDNELWVMDADGANQAQLDAGPVQDHMWLDATTVVYQVSVTSIERIDRDGTNHATLKSGLNLAGFQVSPDGTQVAYITLGMSAYELHVMDADGTNDNTIVANLLEGFGSFAPSWRTDGSAILFNYNGGIDTIAPDGSGQTTQVASRPNGYWYWTGMADDRFFLIDQTTFTQWKLGQVVFGSGYSLVSPTLYCARNVHKAAPYVAQGRVFVVQDGSLMGGVDSLVSVLPDGSDLTAAFVPDESGSPLFQNVALI